METFYLPQPHSTRLDELEADGATMEDLLAALADYVEKNEYTGQATFCFERNGSLGNPEDFAPAGLTQEQKEAYRKAYQLNLTWSNSSTLPIVGPGTDEMAFYWSRGYNVNQTLTNEPRVMEAFESWWSNGVAEFMEWHMEGHTEEDVATRSQFRCETAIYPRKRFSSLTSPIDACSAKSFNFQQINFSALSVSPYSSQYNGTPMFYFDFKNDNREFVIETQSKVFSNVVNAPWMYQAGVSGRVSLPYIDGLDRLRSDAEIFASQGIYVPTGEAIRVDGLYQLGLNAGYTVAQLDDASGFFSGYNATWSSGIKSITSGNVYGVRQAFDRVVVFGGATTGAGQSVNDLFRFQASENTSLVPLLIGSTQLRWNSFLELWNSSNSRRDDLAMRNLTAERAHLSGNLFANKVLIGTNQVEIAQDGFGLQMPTFRSSLAALGASSRVGTIALNMSPNTTGRGLVIEQSDSNNGAFFCIDTWAASNRVRVDRQSGFSIKPLSSASPSENTQLCFEMTSNTQLTLKMQGSDGVVRTTTLTMS